MRYRSCTRGCRRGETDVHHRFDVNGKSVELWLTRLGSNYQLRLPDQASHMVALIEETPGYGYLVVDGVREPIAFAVEGDTVHVHCRGRASSLEYVDPLVAFASTGDDAGRNVARAPMPGVVVAVKVASGESVVAGTVLIVIESMKLETAIKAPKDGTIERIHFDAGDSFDRDAVLVTLSQENG